VPRSINSTASATDPAIGFTPKAATNSPSPRGEGRGEGDRHQWLKFSGNAQRRRRNAILFHGTILYAFDLSLIDALLRFPSAQPEYRASRPHTDFVRNVPASGDGIRAALSAAWKAETELASLPTERIAQLVREQYVNEEWNRRR
jgi:lipoate-protein ligase A